MVKFLVALYRKTDLSAVQSASNLPQRGPSTAEPALARADTLLSILVLSVSLMAAGAGVWALPHASATTAGAKSDGPAANIQKPRKDLFGDPLPPGALARLGTVRQRAPNSDIAVTADGKEIVTYGRNTVRRFDAATGELRQISHLPLSKEEMSSRPALLSPRGTFVLFLDWGQPDGSRLWLWNLNQRKQVDTLALDKPGVLHGVFSADESTVALATSSSKTSGEVVIWDLKTSHSKRFPIPHGELKDPATPAVVLSPDGKRVVAWHVDQVLRCWDVENDTLLWKSEKKLGYTTMCFSPDGKKLVTPSGYGTPEIDIRDAVTGEFLAKDKKTPDKKCFPLGFSPDGKFLVYQNDREELRVWDPTTDKAAVTLPGPRRRPASSGLMIRRPFDLSTWAFTPDGKALIRRCDSLQRWDLTTGKAVYEDTGDGGHSEDIRTMVFSPNGKLLASSANDHSARIWDVATSKPLQTLARCGAAHLSFTPDGQRLLALPVMAPDKSTIAVWDVATGKEGPGYDLVDRRDFTRAATDREPRVSADGKKVLLLTYKGNPRDNESMLTVWDAATRECLLHKRVPWNEEGIITPDGEAVLTMELVNGFATGKVELFDIATEKARWSLMPVERVLERTDLTLNWSPAVSPRGRWMACVLHLFHKRDDKYEVDDAIYVGDLATGRERMRLRSSSGAMVAFSDDERLFVVASDEVLRLFETSSWQEVGTIKMPTAPDEWPGHGWVRDVAISPDGRTIATGHSDSTILLWDAALRAGARGQPLTAAQADSLWTDLAGKNAAQGYAAIWRLVDDPERAVVLLKDRLEPHPPAAEKVRALLSDLDSDVFDVRESAEKKLLEWGELVASDLRTALKASPSAEKKRRLESLLGALDSEGPLAGQALRAERAVQILERIGSNDALALLKKLAEGAKESRTTKAAKQALERLGKR